MKPVVVGRSVFLFKDGKFINKDTKVEASSYDLEEIKKIRPKSFKKDDSPYYINNGIADKKDLTRRFELSNILKRTDVKNNRDVLKSKDINLGLMYTNAKKDEETKKLQPTFKLLEKMINLLSSISEETSKGSIVNQAPQIKLNKKETFSDFCTGYCVDAFGRLRPE